MKCSSAFSTEIKMKVKKMLNFTKTLDYKVEESGETAPIEQAPHPLYLVIIPCVLPLGLAL